MNVFKKGFLYGLRKRDNRIVKVFSIEQVDRVNNYYCYEPSVNIFKKEVIILKREDFEALDYKANNLKKIKRINNKIRWHSIT